MYFSLHDHKKNQKLFPRIKSQIQGAQVITGIQHEILMASEFNELYTLFFITYRKYVYGIITKGSVVLSEKRKL